MMKMYIKLYIILYTYNVFMDDYKYLNESNPVKKYTVLRSDFEMDSIVC